MSDITCKGCVLYIPKSMCTIADTSKCPCLRCLVKMVCIDACDDMKEQTKLNFFMKQVRGQ